MKNTVGMVLDLFENKTCINVLNKLEGTGFDLIYC
jgi:hypothetical protein